MPWTISRRIALGFSLSVLLLAILASIAWWALRSSTREYTTALEARRGELVPTLRLESELRSTNVEFLRFVIEPTAGYDRRRDSTMRLVEQLITQVRGREGRDARWDDVAQLVQRWDAAARRSMDAARRGDEATALNIRRNEVQPVRTELDARLDDVTEAITARTDSIAASGAATAEKARTGLIIGALLALLASIASALGLGRAINRPLQETSGVLATSAAEILAATTEQASGTNESMAAVSETVATVEQVTQTAAQAAERVRMVAETAQRAAEQARQGRTAVDDSVAAMRALETQVGGIAERIVALAEQAQSIGEITGTVADIAEQTKLLALNAAVEAARAGEHGRGFAVVAGEVKALAGQAKDATAQVRQLLASIQRATNAAVLATEHGTRQVTAATRQVNVAGDVIAALAEASTEAAQAAAQITASANQQAIGLEQIRQAIGNIQDATQQHLAATRQTESAAQELNRVGGHLLQLVGTSRETAFARARG
jgi:methyl-accepting chemotaxis protein